jgi:ubiquinone/menaquinone biosynthesis C-methylase UbiE
MQTSGRVDLGELTDIQALGRLVDVDGLSLIDVGCGAGHLARCLAELGAIVLGIEPDPAQAERNRAADPVPNVTLLEAGAEKIPADDQSVDGVMFFRSLHHVPRQLMDAALMEAARVLKPEGFLCVVEPGMDGSHYAMMRPFHDETEARTLAQEALARTAEGLFDSAHCYLYMQHPRHESFDTMVEFFTSLSFNDITREMIDVPEVHRHFEAARTDDGYVFEQPTLVNVYRHPKAS